MPSPGSSRPPTGRRRRLCHGPGLAVPARSAFASACARYSLLGPRGCQSPETVLFSGLLVRGFLQAAAKDAPTAPDGDEVGGERTAVAAALGGRELPGSALALHECLCIAGL